MTGIGTSTAAPTMCIATRTSFVSIGIGGVGIRSGKKSERMSTTRQIAAKLGAGLRAVLATTRKTTAAPNEKTMLTLQAGVNRKR